MDTFPSLKSVGDMLALGVEIAPEQEALVSAPAGRPMVAVWGLPDPQLESGLPYYVNGMPVVIPVIMENCKPGEEASMPWLRNSTLGELLASEEDPFPVPTIVGELDPMSDFPYRMGDFEIMDEHYGRQPWDLWPVDADGIKAFNNAVSIALDESGYLPLIDFIGWENGYDEPADDSHRKYVEDRVLDPATGWLKDPEEFKFELLLPPEHKYTWDRLIDLSQQGTQSYGMTLPAAERDHFFRSNGATPWF